MSEGKHIIIQCGVPDPQTRPVWGLSPLKHPDNLVFISKFSLSSQINCVFCSWVSTWNWSCSSRHQCPIPQLTLGHCHVRTKRDLFYRVFEQSISWSYKLTHFLTLKFSIYHKGKNSPSSPAVRDLLDRHQASLGRSQSFSHQQPSRSHIMRYFTWTPPRFNYYSTIQYV